MKSTRDIKRRSELTNFRVMDGRAGLKVAFAEMEVLANTNVRLMSPLLTQDANAGG